MRDETRSRERKRDEDKFIKKNLIPLFSFNQHSQMQVTKHPLPLSPLLSFFSHTQLFSQSRVRCEIQYVSECLCALAVLYSNDLVDLPALICREAFSTH